MKLFKKSALFVLSMAMLSGACSSSESDDGVDAGTDGGNGDVGGGDTSADGVTDGSAATDAGSDAADSASDATADGSGDAADGSGGRDVEDGDCSVDSDCPARFACIEGECVKRCGTAIDCSDGNACTEDTCTDGVCAFLPIDPAIADVERGDCRRFACVEGVLAEVADPTDPPADDGVFCSIEECNDRFPVTRLDSDLCDDGDESNGFETCRPDEGGCVSGSEPPWVCDEFDPGWLIDEECGNGQDDDNDGIADEGCPCEFGSVQRCFVGAPGARNVGGCLDGFQQCQNRDAPAWGPCEGGILPGEETCDAKDNDCDGCVDDIPDCEPLLSCPVEDEARPLRFYPLDASAIFDGEGLEWTWTVIAPPNSATRGAEDPDAARTQVYLDVSGDYQISLTVRDDKGDLLGCSWVVHVSGAGLRVEMRWDTFGSVDMDLHLGRDGRPFCTDDDCYYANCRVWRSVDWGYPDSPADACEVELGASSCPNPRLDIDNISGFDPENINIDNPNDGDLFRVMAHKFSGTRATNPVLSIYCGGRLRGVFGEAPDLATLTSSGGGCQGNTWRVADVIMVVDEATGATDCSLDVLTSAAGGYDIRTATAAW